VELLVGADRVILGRRELAGEQVVVDPPRVEKLVVRPTVRDGSAAGTSSSPAVR